MHLTSAIILIFFANCLFQVVSNVERDPLCGSNGNHKPVWFQHVQRCGGYLACSYARQNNVLDYATKIGCPSCPCGHGDHDKMFQGYSPYEVFGYINGSNPRPSHTLQFSKKDSSHVSSIHPSQFGGKPVGFLEVEYHTFQYFPPDREYFIYITVLRNPLHRTLSWISRFRRKEWGKVLSSRGSYQVEGARKLLTQHQLLRQTIRAGGFPQHSSNAYVETFSSQERGPPSVSNALQGLKSFHLVMIFEVLSTYGDDLMELLCWKNGTHFLSAFGKSTNTYARYTHFNHLSDQLQQLFRKVLVQDIAIYNHYAKGLDVEMA